MGAKVKIMMPTQPSELRKTIGYYTEEVKDSKFFSMTEVFDLTWDDEEIKKYIGKNCTVVDQVKHNGKPIDKWYVTLEEFPSFKICFPESGLHAHQVGFQFFNFISFHLLIFLSMVQA